MKKYKYKNFTCENPLDILNKTNLLDSDNEFNKEIKVVKNNDKIEDITLKEFVNDGVEFLIEETKDNANSGEDAQVANSGEDAKVANSGNNAQVANTGNYAQVANSGENAQVANSGYNAKVANSGDYAQVANSGEDAQVESTGKNSVVFSCGINSIIKAENDTWISLAEFECINGKYIPTFAKSAQIDNSIYKDFKNNVLSNKYYYQLINKEFTPILIIDGYRMVILSKKKKDDLTIYKTQYVNDFIDKEETTQYVVSNGKFNAHGETIKEAIADLQFKILQSQEVQDHIKRVVKQGYMMAQDYRLITGACQYGTNKWLEENGYTWNDKKSIEEVLELVKGEYGYERLKAEFEKYKKEVKDE